jgi:hypothetical protein
MDGMKTVFLILAAAAAGCSGVSGGRIPGLKVSAKAHQGDENLILYVGNVDVMHQRIDLEVAVDGAVVYRDVLDRGKTFHDPMLAKREVRLAIEPGEHVITAKSSRGAAKFSRQFRMAGKRWAALLYEGGAEPFQFTIRSGPIRFD